MASAPPSRAAKVTTSESDLPLNLFEVLEEESVALHGALSDDHPDWSVTADQVLDADAIIEALKKAETEPPGRCDPGTAFSRHLLTLLPDRRDNKLESGLTRDTLAVK